MSCNKDYRRFRSILGSPCLWRLPNTVNIVRVATVTAVSTFCAIWVWVRGLEARRPKGFSNSWTTVMGISSTDFKPYYIRRSQRRVQHYVLWRLGTSSEEFLAAKSFLILVEP